MMTRFKNWKKPKIKHNKPTRWGWMVAYPENLKLGYGVDIGAFTYIQCKHGVSIGDHVQIGGGTKIFSENSEDQTSGAVIISEGAMIGANSVILPNVFIGRCARIGALSLIKKSVPDNTTVMGVWA